ncbi:MAG: poly-beta-1,6-N-acetyl-D-glucosamine biosynthesis protein PgaD [Pseudomonadota bacterium]
MSSTAHRPPIDLVIDRPDRQSLGQRYGHLALTVMFWAIWLYLWLPLITLVMWGLGIHRFYDRMVFLEGYRVFLENIVLYQSVIVAIGVIYIGWALWNNLRFKDIERRKATPLIDDHEMTDFFAISQHDLVALRSASSATIVHNRNGAISRIVVDDGPNKQAA